MNVIDRVILELPIGNITSTWTIGNAVEGVQIFGGIGSGKTTGPGRLLALKYLHNKFGGLVLTVKPDEKDMWVDYCEKTGRKDDLIIVEPDGKHFFNFIDYESRQGEDEKSITENLVQVLKTVINAGEGRKGGGSNDKFWEDALDMLIFNIIDLCKLAYGEISIERLYDIALSLPKKAEDLNNIQRLDNADEEAEAETRRSAYQKAYALADWNVDQKVEEWRCTQHSAAYLTKLAADFSFFSAEAKNAIPEVRLMEYVRIFFHETFLTLADKTRSVIEFSFSSFLFRLLRDPVYSLFCKNKSTFTPEDSFKGKIILINLPVKLYYKFGRDSQIMFKYIWQRAMERRVVDKKTSLPVFLWADEAQNFLHEHDADYQATARSSMIATVYISQNLPNYHANMSGDHPDHRVKSFLGTLATKIFNANADIETNRYASELIGDYLFSDVSQTTSMAQQTSLSNTQSFKHERIYRPEAFLKLATGGLKNNKIVAGIMHIQGNTLPDGLNHIPMVFNQDYIPLPHT